MKKKKSKLIHIPKGSPFWAEPLMKNLYLLEELINNSEGGGEGGGEGSDELWREIEKLQEKHKADVFDIEKKINEIFTIVIGEFGDGGLASQVKMHDTDIEKMYEIIESMDSLTMDGVFTAIEEVVAPVRKKTTELENDSNISKEEIKTIKEKEKELRERIRELEEIVDEIKTSNKDYHHIVNTEQEMDSITQKGHGSLCFVRAEMQLFIWDGKWTPITPDHSIKKIQWEDIIDAPISQPSTIDSAVSLMHTHGNKTALDTITFSTINAWDSKADSSEIPTKLSELENDIGTGGDYDGVIKEIKDVIGNVAELSTEHKSDLVGALNEINAQVKEIEEIKATLSQLSEKVAYLEK